MKTKQKKLKFSKGQISSRLLERQDLDVLDSSASEITNFISTPYGGLQTRQGTENQEVEIEGFTTIPFTATSYVGGDTSDLPNGGSFISDGLGDIADDTELLRIDMGSDVPIQTANIACYFEPKDFTYSFTVTEHPLTPQLKIIEVNIVSGGENIVSTDLYYNAYSTPYSQAIVPTINSSGVITSLYINSEPNKLMDMNGVGEIQISNTVNSSQTIFYEISSNGSDWTAKGSFTANSSTSIKSLEINATTRYIRLVSDGVKGRITVSRVYISSNNLLTANVRLEGFSFNEEQQYLLYFVNGAIGVIEENATVVLLTGLTNNIISTLKVTQQEDVMVITHPDLEPQQLVRDTNYSATFTGETSDVITSTGTVFYNGLIVRLTTTDTLPAGLSLATDYYVIDANGDECKLSLTKDGSPVNITDTGTGTHTLTVQGVYWTFGDFPISNIPKFAFSGEITTAKTTTLDPDVTEGLVTITESGAGSGTTFTTASVGQIIDGGGGRVLITDYISATKIRGITIIPFYTADAFTNFNYITGYEDVWSSTRGWPNSCLFYQQRLWFGGSKSRPNTIWGSRVDDYSNFKNVGNFDNDSIEATIASNQVNEIINIFPNRGLQVFTAGGEWVVPESSMTPDNFQIINNTANGAKKGITPVNISGTTLFIEKNGKSLLSFTYNDGQGTYVTSQMSLLTDLIQNPIDMDLAMNSSQNEANYLYIVNEDGTMVVSCIMMDHKINSYVKFETDGKFKDVCVLGDDVYVLTERDSGLYLEKFVEGLKTDNTKEYTITAGVVTIDSGYEGKTVHAYDDTNDYGTHVVTGGEIEIDKSSGTVYVGLDFEYTLLSNKISINTQTDNIEKRIAKATIVTKDTETLTFCNQTITQEDDVFEYYGVTSPNRDTRFTITGEFVPVEILSILLNINYGDK